MTKKVFLDYDQAALDYEMNLRGRWPDHQHYFDRWARESLAVRKTHNCYIDLVFGETEGQKLDLFLPERIDTAKPPAGMPLLAFIHGGYWKSLDKGDFSYLAPAYLERGIAFASLNYDLAPGADIAEMVAQVRRGFAWLWRNAGEYELDATRFYVAGHSAGGHLAAMAMNPDWTVDHGLPEDAIKGGCSVSGVYDLAAVAASFQQDELKIAPEVVAQQSPLRSLPSRAAPLICAVGSGETKEFIRQHSEYVAAWRQKGLPCRTVDLVGDDHFSAADRLSDRHHPLFQAVCDMISSGTTT